MLVKRNLMKNPNIGLYIMATEGYILLPEYARERDVETFSKTLEVRPITTRVSGTSLLGVFTVGGKDFIILPWIAEEDADKFREEGIEVFILKDKVTALGNLIALNSRGALVSEEISPRAKKEIEDFLGIEVLRKNIAGVEVVGAALVVTEKGFIVHPSINPNDMALLEELFGVRGETTTVNFGDPFVKTGVVANSKGIIVGEDTSPVEILKIESALGVEV